MIGVIVVETYLDIEVADHPAVSPLIPAGCTRWTDVTGAYPQPPDAVAIQVEAPSDWFDALPDGSVLWTE